ncbi:inverse autotransporter beta domain-containing protein [Thorsellia anophelis]|uniref:Invasin beta-domain of outer membrane n=1 Tax=Thorsellia anophelis DSM 18579 TaxID=1123402 RepID=A0A1I0FIU3_9GAMM|nr:inverse autotransporter beta domain-containing protein [Thorsellia anophelis]SET57940.1 Invasin beta-domain of outer membrane [Thorsellia anophelis DSM 18579]
MKNITHYKIKTIFILVTILIGLSASAQDNRNQNIEAIKVTDVIIESEISVYQLALKHNLSVADLIALNGDRFEAGEMLAKGSVVKLPQLELASVSDNAPKNNTLPDLGVLSVASEQSTILDLTQGIIPGAQYVTGTAEENFANAVVTTAEEGWENFKTEQIIENAKQQGINTVTSTVNNQINETVSNFLGRFGKAEVNIALNEEGEVTNSELNVLSPLYDKKESLVFSQVGIHEQGSGQDSRTVGNFGIGYRYETADWLAGANAFIDHDFTGDNTRAGLGAEFWADNYKIAANTYAPVSGWKESEVMKSYESLIYDERPAAGFDIRAKAYLPNYPQLGGSLLYEQYFGDEVALFGINERQSDPYSFGVGIDYMPIPLIKTQITHKMGKSGADETKVDLTLNLQLGTPLEEQLDPANVAVARSLKGSRYDMVDRNYDIVFEYKKENFSIALTGDTQATMGQMVNVISTIETRSPIKSYEWSVTDLAGNSLAVITSNTPSITFEINSPENHYVRLKVTTERGYEAISDAHLIKYVDEITNSVLSSGNAEVIKFEDYPILETQIDNIPEANKAVLVFEAFDTEGKPFDLTANPDISIFWKNEGSKEPYQLINDDDEYVRIVTRFNREANNELSLVALADDSFIEEGVTRRISVKIVSEKNSNITAVGEVAFTHPSDLMIDPENLIIEIWEVPAKSSSGATTFANYSNLVSRSGFLNGVPINVIKNPIKPNTEYRAKILHATDPIANPDFTVDVTERYVQSIVWLYWDPVKGVEITAKDRGYELVVDGIKKEYNALEGCRGTPIFLTQISNYEFNELAWGEILAADNAAKSRQDMTVTEQGLRLAVQFDFRSINEENPIIEDCKPSLDSMAEETYLGYMNNNKSEIKATSWSDTK